MHTLHMIRTARLPCTSVHVYMYIYMCMMHIIDKGATG